MTSFKLKFMRKYKYDAKVAKSIKIIDLIFRKFWLWKPTPGKCILLVIFPTTNPCHKLLDFTAWKLYRDLKDGLSDGCVTFVEVIKMETHCEEHFNCFNVYLVFYIFKTTFKQSLSHLTALEIIMNYKNVT